MALTRISDVIVPEVFDAYMQIATKEKSTVFQSGLVMDSPALSAKLSGGGTTFQSPVWNDLSDANDSDIASDDPAKVSTPDKLTGFKMQARRQVRTKSWSTADLSGVLAGDKPMPRIVSKVGTWWA